MTGLWQGLSIWESGEGGLKRRLSVGRKSKKVSSRRIARTLAH